MESAEDPKVLREIEKKDIESYDKFLRVGIARTNIYGIMADFRDLIHGKRGTPLK